MTKKTDGATILSVADAKRRFSELIDRVDRGEQVLVSRRGKLVLALVRPRSTRDGRPAPVGLAAVAGALADWHDIDEDVERIYEARRRARDRAVPPLE